METFSCKLVIRQGIVLGAGRESGLLHGGQKKKKIREPHVVVCTYNATAWKAEGNLLQF